MSDNRYAMPWGGIAKRSTQIGLAAFSALTVFAKVALHGQKKRDIESVRLANRWTDAARWE